MCSGGRGDPSRDHMTGRQAGPPQDAVPHLLAGEAPGDLRGKCRPSARRPPESAGQKAQARGRPAAGRRADGALRTSRDIGAALRGKRDMTPALRRARGREGAIGGIFL